MMDEVDVLNGRNITTTISSVIYLRTKKTYIKEKERKKKRDEHKTAEIH